MKIILTVLFAVFSLTAGISYSQGKIFLPSENNFVTIVNFEDDINPDINYYSGKYTYIWPGMNDAGEPVGDAMGIDYVLSVNIQGEILFFKVMNIEGDEEEFREEYRDVNLAENNLTVLYEGKNISGQTEKKICTGKFVYLKYKMKGGKTKSSPGLYFKGWDDYEAVFYEKQKQ